MCRCRSLFLSSAFGLRRTCRRGSRGSRSSNFGRRGRRVGFFGRAMFCRRFGRSRRLILRNTKSREPNNSDENRNFCNHNRERKKAKGLKSIQFRRHLSGRGPERNFTTGLERAGRLRYPLPGGPDSGMPEVGCGGLCRRLCPDEAVRGQPDSRRHSQASLQNKADQARHIRFIDIRSNAFRFGVAARAKIGLR